MRSYPDPPSNRLRSHRTTPAVGSVETSAVDLSGTRWVRRRPSLAFEAGGGIITGGVFSKPQIRHHARICIFDMSKKGQWTVLYLWKL
jgi:hypothetical protein